VVEVEDFLDEMLLIYPGFGKPQPAKTAARRYDLRARGAEAAAGFVVPAGSGAKDSVPSAQGYLLALRAALQARGVIVPSGDGLEVAQDYTFDAPRPPGSSSGGRRTAGR
jgi:hypothetical protein